MEKDQDIEDTYSSIFIESKLFKNKETVSSMDLEDVAEFVFMNFIALWVMYNEELTKDTAMSYADRTAGFSTFKNERMMGTDLYVALNTLVKDDSTVSKNLADKNNSHFRAKLNINQPTIKSFLEAMSNASLSDNDAARFLLKLQRMINITNTTYKSMGRSAAEWNKLNKNEKNHIISRLVRYFNNSARKCEIRPMLNDLAHSHAIDTDNENAKDGIKSLAIAAGTMYAGYQLGKVAAKIIDAKRLMR